MTASDPIKTSSNILARRGPSTYGPPGTAVDLQRTRVHDMAADAVRLEKAVQPEPVAAGLIAARRVRAHAGAAFHAGPDAGEQVEHRLSVAGGEPMQLDLGGIGACSATSQERRLSSRAREIVWGLCGNEASAEGEENMGGLRK